MAFPLNNPYFLGVAVIALLNTVLLIVLIWKFRGYRKIQRELLRGEEVADLEGIVLKHKKTINSLSKNLKELGQIIGELVENNRLNIQKVGVVRFNPFADTGGNMSFAIALLDGRNNGIVISSLHGREATRIYAKSIENGSSKHHLTEEEKEALVQANKSS